MLRFSSSKNRFFPASSEKISADRNLARASPSGIFPRLASDSPNFSADSTIFQKHFGANFGTGNSKKPFLENHENTAFSTTFSKNNSTLKKLNFSDSSKANGYLAAENSSAPTEFSANLPTSSQMLPDIRKRSRIARGSCPTSLMSLRGPPTQVVNFQPSPEAPASPAISPSVQMSTTVTSPEPRAVARSAVQVSSSPGSSPESLGDDDRRVESSVETPRPAAFAPATPLGESSQINSRIDPTDSPVGDDQGTYNPVDSTVSPAAPAASDQGRRDRTPARASRSISRSQSPSSSQFSPSRVRIRVAADSRSDELSQSPRVRLPRAVHEQNIIRRNFHHELGPLTKVLDVPFELFGSLCGIANPIRFIPEKHLEQTRVVLTRIIKSVTDHHDPTSNDPQLLLAYKKLFFFILIICNNAGNSKDIKDSIKENLDLIQRDDWDSFTLGGLQLRSFHVPAETTDDHRRKKVSKSLANGRLSRGYQEWVKPRPLIQQDDGVFETLSALYPDPGPGFLSDEERQRYQQRVTEFENAPVNDEPASIERVGQVVMSRQNLVKAGFDHLTPEFVKKCWGMKSDQRQIDFRKVFTLLINLVRSGRIPPAVRPIFSDTEAFAIPKKDGSVRPLGTGNFLRKIAAVVSLKSNYPQINRAFAGVQLGFEKHGTEKCIHSMRLVREINPDYDFVCPDGINAFPNSSREAALSTAIQETPGMFSLLKLLYGDISKSWFAGCQDGITSIDCKEGSVQGCPIGPLLCALAFIVLFRLIAALIFGSGIALFFFDDGNMVTTFDKMLEVLKILIDQGPKCGYKIHFDKGDFLLGVTDSFELALERRQQLIDLGFKPANIKIHPSDLLLGNYRDIEALGLSEDFDEQTRLAYGARVLGGFIGDDAYIQAQLNAKAEELEAEADRLIELGDPQKCYLFARYCFSEKDNHIYRTTNPHLVLGLAERVNRAKKKVLCKGILGGFFDVDTLPDWVWTQACFSINDGGLGLKDSVLTSYAAYVASMADCYPDLEKACPGFLGLDIPSVRALRDSLRFISDCASASDSDGVSLSFQDVLALSTAPGNQAQKGGIQYLLSQLMHDAIRKRFKNSLTPKHLAWYNSVSSETAGPWLNVLPKNDTTTFEPDEFIALVFYRLYLRQPELCEGLRCDCTIGGRHPLIDENCLHLVTGCKKQGMGIRLHHSIALTLKDLSQSAGFRAKTEEFGTFIEFNNLLTAAQMRMRGDVTIFDLPGGFRKTILDVSTTCVHPILSNVHFDRGLAKPGVAAQKRYDEKVRKYDDAAKALKFKFQPIIFDSTGRMHAKSEVFINSILKHITGFKDGALLQDYWRKKVSCVFQHEVASHLLDKLRMLKGSLLSSHHYENRSVYAAESALTDRLIR